MTPDSCLVRNSICAAALKEGDLLRIGQWEFRTRIFHETYESSVKTTGIHSHETFYELSRMNLGSMEYRINGRLVETRAEQKDWVLIPAGQPHRRTCLKPPAVIQGFLFETESFRESSWPLQKFNKEIEKAGYHFAGNAELNDLHDTMLEELVSEKPLKAQRISLLIRELLLCFLREHFPFLTEESPAQRNDSELSLRIITSYIDENISRAISLDDIASCCGLSIRHANRAFAREHGISIGKHILEKRMGIARREIEATSRQIKDIALELGYDDISYFNRIFKRMFGITPLEARRRWSSKT